MLGIQRSYGRKEEYQADAHGVEILQRAGYEGRSLMADTLTWLTQVEGTGGGGDVPCESRGGTTKENHQGLS